MIFHQAYAWVIGAQLWQVSVSLKTLPSQQLEKSYSWFFTQQNGCIFTPDYPSSGFTVVLLLDLGFAQARNNPLQQRHQSLLTFLDGLVAELGGRFRYFLPWHQASQVLDSNLQPVNPPFVRHPNSHRLQDLQSNTVAAVSTKYRHIIGKFYYHMSISCFGPSMKYALNRGGVCPKSM